MKKIMIIISLALLVGCAEKEEKSLTSFLQTDYIKILKTTEEYKDIVSGKIDFHMTDGVFSVGGGSISQEGKDDILVVVSNCDNDIGKLKYCGGIANIPENEDQPFYNYNYVKEEEGYVAYYFGIIEGDMDAVSYDGKKLEMKKGYIELDGKKQEYVLWLYKTDIQEDFDRELLDLGGFKND